MAVHSSASLRSTLDTLSVLGTDLAAGAAAELSPLDAAAVRRATAAVAEAAAALAAVPSGTVAREQVLAAIYRGLPPANRGA